MLKSIAKLIFNLIPLELKLLFRAAQRYIDRFNGDNNCDPSTIGEKYLLRRLLPKMHGGVVFDVGANVGNWSRYCLAIDPILQIHMFEPSAATFQKLSGAKWPDSVKLNNIGLGERDEILQLNIVETTSGINSIYKRHGVKSAKVKSVEPIQIKTIDAYCEEEGIEHISFLKVDVEGHELAVFKGAKKLLEKRAIDLIQFEYGGCNLDARVYLFDIWKCLTQKVIRWQRYAQ